ncbi:MAG: hypothetical protein FD177_1493 [Desulfovibrionaceae bacterium]|nr:MAG: hypothetical protein FD177_1493 [Desulfovibrionaceae bacterium]
MGKNQHFVPQFYLRNFSISGNSRGISCYNISRRLLICQASIRGQASKDNFYDNDGTVEEYLSKIEGLFSDVIRSIIDGVCDYSSDSFQSMMKMFMINLYVRTEKMAADVERALDKIVRIVSRERVSEDMQRFLDSAMLKLNHPGTIMLNNVKSILDVIYDLDVVVLKNCTSVDFVTSDNPVAIYNMYLERRGFKGGLGGLSLKGVQIIVPISPRYVAMAYDPEVYRVGGGSFDRCVRNVNDVRSINKLQCVNAGENIMFSNVDCCREIVSSISELNKLRSSVKSVVRCAQKYEESGGADKYIFVDDYRERKKCSSELIMFQRGSLRISFGLTFVSIKSSAKKHKLGNNPVRSWAVKMRYQHALDRVAQNA